MKTINGKLPDKTPVQYITFDRDRLYDILSTNTKLYLIDQLKMGVLGELLADGLTLNDIMHLYRKYAINYQANKASIKIRRTMEHIHELPEEISFVTCWIKEEDREWDCKCRND